jgi:transposase InsO family protein
MLILHLFCRVVDVKADSTLKLVSACKLDSIWVIVDRPIESTRFIPINTKYRAEKYAEIYIARVLCLHGVLKMIISDRGSQFIARFWEQLHASLGTHLIHSSACHPQTDGQTERVNQILEDMLNLV